MGKRVTVRHGAEILREEFPDYPHRDEFYFRFALRLSLRPSPSSADFLRGRWRLQQRTVHCLPSGLNPDLFSMFCQKHTEILFHAPGLAPSLKMLVDSAFCTMAGGQHGPFTSLWHLQRIPTRMVRWGRGGLPRFFCV